MDSIVKIVVTLADGTERTFEGDGGLMVTNAQEKQPVGYAKVVGKQIVASMRVPS